MEKKLLGFFIYVYNLLFTNGGNMTIITLIERFLMNYSKKEIIEVRIEEIQTARTYPILYTKEVIKNGKTCFYIAFDIESVG